MAGVRLGIAAASGTYGARYTFPVPPPVERKSGYLPGLDGLRALAILGVLMAHDLPWTIAGHSNEKWKGYGGWGVQLFFALSGVLICWRLLEDEAKLGHINLKDFYIRRLFRIQPAALAYLGVVALLFVAGAIPYDWHLWWSAVLSYANFLITVATPPGAAAFLGHFWTLAVEEHFYILISLLFLVARRRRTALLVCLLAALLIGQKFAESRGQFSTITSIRRTYWVIQFLLFPALLALLVRRPKIRDFAARYASPGVAALAILLAMWLNIALGGVHLLMHEVRHFSPLFLVSYNINLVFYGYALIVIAVMLHPRSLTTRFLELKPMRFVGRLSYSIYLWHIPFFIPVFLPDQIHSKLMLTLAGRPWKYLATAAVALLSYFLIEKPLIRYGHKLAPPATAGHRDLSALPAQRNTPQTQTPATAEFSG